MNFYLMHFIDLHIGFILFHVIPCHSFHSFCSCHIYFINLIHVVSGCLVGLMWGFVKTPISIKWFFRALSFFPSYRFPRRWLHTLIKQFILWFLWGMPASNHKLYMCFFGKSSTCKVAIFLRKTRCTSSKVGSVSDGPFLTTEVIVFIIVLSSFWSTCHMLQIIKLSGNPSTT